MRPEPWQGVLWFGWFALLGLGVAWGIRRQLAQGRTPGRGSPRQQRFAMAGFGLIGLIALGLDVGELVRWIT